MADARRFLLLASLSLLVVSPLQAAGPKWPAAVAPVIPGASGFVVIPGAAVPPTSTRIYKAVYDATHAAAHPNDLLPAIDMAGSELNALGAMKVPVANARFTLVFHGDALDGILDDVHYRQKFGVPNPNLPVLAQMRRQGVKLYVCGQNLAFAHIDPATLSRDVAVASDALIVLMTCQSDGDALLSY